LQSLTASSALHVGAWRLCLPPGIYNQATNAGGKPSRKIMNFWTKGMYSLVAGRGQGALLPSKVFKSHLEAEMAATVPVSIWGHIPEGKEAFRYS